MATRPERADRGQRHRPRKQEGDFEIEDDEQDGDQVVAHVEPRARVLEGLEAALVGRELFRIPRQLRAELAEQRAEAQQHDGQTRRHDEKDQDGQIFGEHEPSRLKGLETSPRRVRIVSNENRKMVPTDGFERHTLRR